MKLFPKRQEAKPALGNSYLALVSVKAAPSSECFLAALGGQITSFLWGHPVLGGPHFWEAFEVGMSWGGFFFCFPLVIILQTVGVESLALKNKTRPVMCAIEIQLHSLLGF